MYVRVPAAAMLPAVVVVALQVPVAVPVVFTVRTDPATVRAVARGADPFDAVRLTVTLSFAFAVVPPPTVLAAVILVAVKSAGLTELTVKLLVNGQLLHVSPVGAVPFTETNILKFVTMLFAVTVQLNVT